MEDCMNYPNTAMDFIKGFEFRDVAEAYTNGSFLVPVFRVEQMIEHYFNAKPKSSELSAEDFVKAINANLDMLITIGEEKKSNGTTDEINTIMLKYTKKFINEFVNTSVVKTEDGGDSDNGKASKSKIPCVLDETVDLMCSSDYKDRFKAEYYQLRIRYESLMYMLHKWDTDGLDFEPTCPRSTYDLQIKAMKEYLTILEARAKIEGIELQ